MWRDPDRPRKKAAEGEQAGGEPAVREAARPERVVACESCTQVLARADDRVEIAGRHHHTCVNPAGYVYRIGCFRRAPGCVGHGTFTEEHSWFAGYTWQIALCARCAIHLGWAFRSEGGAFHGLILDRIVERDA